MNRNTIIYLLIGLVVLVGLFILLRPQQKASAPTLQQTLISPTEMQQPEAKTFTLVVRNGKLVGGQETLTVTQGDMVVIKITIDHNNEFHLHGYDKSVDLKKDKQGELSFTADTSGRFPYELHEGKIELGALEVQPK